MGEMSDKAVQARREYAKKWREANPDKVKAAQKRYWEKKAKELQKKKESVTGVNQGMDATTEREENRFERGKR